MRVRFEQSIKLDGYNYYIGDIVRIEHGARILGGAGDKLLTWHQLEENTGRIIDMDNERLELDISEMYNGRVLYVYYNDIKEIQIIKNNIE